jgi:hypothetical protein
LEVGDERRGAPGGAAEVDAILYHPVFAHADEREVRSACR